MKQTFHGLIEKQNLIKMRLIFIAGVLCSYIFYYFMKEIGPGTIEFFGGRVLISILSLIGFILTFTKISRRWITLSRVVVFAAYIFLYLYLLFLNDWSVFHRWSYFAVGIILSAISFSWKEYLFVAFLSFFPPIVLGFVTMPLTLLELFHFHVTNLTLFFVIGISVRENFRYQLEAIELSKKLAEDSKIAALGAMATAFAHEINNPLTVIVGKTVHLGKIIKENESEENKIIVPILDRIHESCFKISHIIGALRDFAREPEGEVFDRLSAFELVEKVALLFRELFKVNNVDFQNNIQVDLNIIGNETQLSRALHSLIFNSFEAVIKLEERWIKIESILERDEVFIAITDSGKGISEELIDRIMEPFFSTKITQKSVGLGLSVAKGIIEAHGGTLKYDEKCMNTRFVIRFPLNTNEYSKDLLRRN